MTTILAIDQSSRVNGVCRIRMERAGQPVYDHDVLTLKKDGSLRLCEFANWLIEELCLGYSLVCIEKPLQVHASGIVLHEIAGLVKYLCHARQQPLLIIQPSQMKKWATGSGNASKDYVFSRAVLRFGEAIVSNDMADAAFLCEMAWHHQTGIPAFTQPRRDILAGLFLDGESPEKAAKKIISARRPMRKPLEEAV